MSPRDASALVFIARSYYCSPMPRPQARTSLKESPSIAERLKKLRRDAGLSQEDLAAKAGLSASTVEQIEQGKKPDPRMNTLRALAWALGVDYAALMGEARRTARKKGNGRPL
jgi:DNA-binding XRE family transcriptional regulator